MASSELVDASFEVEDHRAAFIFEPPTTTSINNSTDHVGTTGRSAKRRKVEASTSSSSSKKHRRPQQGQKLETEGDGEGDVSAAGVDFPALFAGAETPAAARLRKQLFEEIWPLLEKRIDLVLRQANKSTLEEVAGWLGGRGGEVQRDKLTSAFIITGPNIAAQDLLFEQLAERLCVGDGDENEEEEAPPRFVRLRASDAPNLKAALRKIIRDASVGGEEEGVVEVVKGGKKYLDYDLEALHVFLRQHQTKRVVVAFQDGEAFESAVLGDLISLLHSWRDRIRFDLLFGIATSVELFQARLPKSTARQLYGAQFDVVQAGSVLDGVVKTAVASTHAALRIGPTLLRTLVDRQRHHVAGIHAFVASLKYAYMCHFYADPLSVLLAGEDRLTRALLQPEHLEAVRTLDSFKAEVEAAVEARQLRHARSLIEEDEYLATKILENGHRQKEYLLRLLRSLQLITASGLAPVGFTDLYILALAEGIDVVQSSSGTIPLEDAVRKLGPEDFLSLTTRLLTAIETGSPELGLEGWTRDAEDLVTALTELHDEVDALIARTTKNNKSTLKSRYSAASRILRTTVVAQKVQLSRDDATLTDEDRAFTQAIDNLCALLVQHVRCEPLAEQFLHEAWTFDDPRAPYRDVFCPRPGAVLARALARPHDYLACKCCCGVEGKEDHKNVPAASVLYRLYLEAGGLVNVADLWAAYYAFVGGGEEEEEEEGGTEEERKALVKFYRGLAELRMMGFVRPSRRKADHVAKVKWL